MSKSVIVFSHTDSKGITKKMEGGLLNFVRHCTSTETNRHKCLSRHN
uniref:Uncharacterized protein n=1 Tax=Arundo donax TaxID=35708 RepID=A0A0A8YZF8_ARUDO